MRSLITTGLQSPQGLALDPLSGYLYWADFGTDKIQRVPLDGSGVEDLVTDGVSARSPQPGGGRRAGRLYWTDSATDKIQRATSTAPAWRT